MIMRTTANSGHPTKAVVFLTLSEEEVYTRFENAKKLGDRGQRADDNSKVLSTRLEKFHHKVMPVIEWYREKNLLIEIDGGLIKDEVTQAILTSLEKRALA